nr:glycosyltransferase [Micromonospora sp. DSM 115978]
MSAEVLLTRGQIALLTAIGAGAVADVVLFGIGRFLRDAMVLIIVGYTLFTLLKLAVWYAGARAGIPRPTVPSVDDPSLPSYTVLVPLYQETAVLKGLVAALSGVRYPTDRLQVLLLLEAGDDAMIETVGRTRLPAHIVPVVVPDIGPRTKPKACNYAMSLVTGDYLVIFDAEDRPEPDHLLKAVATLRAEHRADPRIACVQAILRFWNPRSGVPSVFYWSEYVAHFNWVLVGLHKLDLILPLCGSSNHFRTEVLREVAAAYGSLRFERAGRVVSVPSVWDSYNITEDADLGARLARLGYRVAVCPAVTHEEAPHRLSVTLRQRTRWLQGYLVTGLVQARRPLRSMRQMGVLRYLAFIMMMVGAPLAGVLNPVLWATTLTYVVARIGGWAPVSLFIEGMFPTPIRYAGLLVMVVGNFFLAIQALLTTLHAANDEEAGLAKWLALTFLWWGFTSLPSYRAVWRLITAPFTWEKTPHGHDQDEEQSVIHRFGPEPAAGGAERQDGPGREPELVRHR